MTSIVRKYVRSLPMPAPSYIVLKTLSTKWLFCMMQLEKALPHLERVMRGSNKDIFVNMLRQGRDRDKCPDY